MNTNTNTETNFNTRPFIYTVIIFLLLCLVSYLANAQAAGTDLPGIHPAVAGALPVGPGTQPVGTGAKSLSLDEALSLALQSNRDIKIAGIDVARAQEEKLVAKSMSLPSAGISGEADHFFSPPVFFGFGSSNGNGSSGDKIPYGRFGGKDQASASFWVTQPLYNAAIRPTRQRSELSEQQSRLLLKDRQTEIIALVRQVYLQLLVLGERVRLQKESLHRNQKALADARSLLAQGRALRVDTLRAFTTVKNLEPDLLKLSYSIEVGKLQLKTLVGIDNALDITLRDSLILPAADSIPTEGDVYTEAGKSRPGLQALALQPGIEDQQVLLAAAARKPLVSLVGQYQVQTQANSFNYFNSYYPSTPFVGARLTIPLFSGGSNLAKIREANLSRRQSVIRLENAREQIRAEVKQAVANSLEAAARIHTRITVKEAARLSYDITQYRYAGGVASRLELTDAELALTTAQSNYLEAVYDYLSARIELDRVRGR
jgi:outer membrane protein TolC